MPSASSPDNFCENIPNAQPETKGYQAGEKPRKHFGRKLEEQRKFRRTHDQREDQPVAGSTEKPREQPGCIGDRGQPVAVVRAVSLEDEADLLAWHAFEERVQRFVNARLRLHEAIASALKEAAIAAQRQQPPSPATAVEAVLDAAIKWHQTPAGNDDNELYALEVAVGAYIKALSAQPGSAKEGE